MEAANEIARYALYMHAWPEPRAPIAYPGRRLEIVALFDRDGDTATRYEGEAALDHLWTMVDR